MSMDDRKRSFEGTADIQTKRLRPEEIIGADPNKTVSRLLLNRAQFSRVIGKGGQTITHVRSATGVYMKGSDVDEENRLVLLSGNLDQVLNAFDYITELLNQALVAEAATNPLVRPDNMAIHLLLEHTKAGKAVGAKGMMMQNIKMKSGANSIRIEKEPMDINGVSLRKFTIEGSLVAIRRAHLLVQELYAEPSALTTSQNYNAFTNNAALPPSSAPGPATMDAMGFPNHGNGFMAHAPAPESMVQMSSVPFPNLVNFGVQAETVRQLTEMKAYLWRHFGLDLTISREVISPPIPGNTNPAANANASNPFPPMGHFHQGPPPHMPNSNNNSSNNLHSLNPMGMMNSSNNTSNNNMHQHNSNSARTSTGGSGLAGRPSIESIIEARRQSNPSELCFSIPKVAVGAIIGKGGQNLRDLQIQYGIRVYIEKEDFNGKRMVVLSPNSAGNTNTATSGNNSITSGIDQDHSHQNTELALRKCQEHIESIVEDQLKKIDSSHDAQDC